MFKTQGIVTKVTTMSDGGVRVQVDTNELSSENAAELMGLNRQFGTFAFIAEGVPVDQKDLEIPEEQKEFPNQKSLSERLRNVLWVLHEKRGGKAETFEDFRRRYMEQIINQIKSKIDEA